MQYKIGNNFNLSTHPPEDWDATGTWEYEGAKYPTYILNPRDPDREMEIAVVPAWVIAQERAKGLVFVDALNHKLRQNDY